MDGWMDGWMDGLCFVRMDHFLKLDVPLSNRQY
jgi:hypothetical protein